LGEGPLPKKIRAKKLQTARVLIELPPNPQHYVIARESSYQTQQGWFKLDYLLGRYGYLPSK
jgi:hypothetical protein